jgi:hypothetical protein
MARLVWLAVVAGCFAPTAPIGVPCATGRACPQGQQCTTTVEGDVCLVDPADVPGQGPFPTGPDGACQPATLLVGGSNIAVQGWRVEASGSATISYGLGYTELRTTGNARQLIVLPNAVSTDRFSVELVLEVIAAGGHTPGNASVALMGSFAAPVGSDADRERMIFLDDGAIGFGDGGTSIGLQTRGSHVYTLERTDDGDVRVTVPGVEMSTGPYTTNGTIAIGDQTTAAGLDSTIRISRVTRLCP